MRRREFITLLGGAVVAWPIAAQGQQGERMRRVGVLMGYAENDPAAQAQIDSFGQELHRLGWTRGRNLQIIYRYGSDDPQRIRALAKELLSLSPDLVVSNANLVTAILKSEAGDVPLVFVSVSDPIGSGFVTNLARPTGNVTGFANFEASMGGKWLETLKEIVPQIERVGFILHPDTPPNVGFLKAAEAAAPTLNVRLDALNVRTRAEIEQAFTTFSAFGSNGGLIVAPHVVTIINQELIIGLAASYRLPAIYSFAYYAKAGGLISYGIDTPDQFRLRAAYVDRILRGTKPADLPVQLPTKYQLVINLRTAKTLGLDVPPTLLARANEVIE
jgi:ABC-type uncharacterized transport system substrate-binding protein